MRLNPLAFLTLLLVMMLPQTNNVWAQDKLVEVHGTVWDKATNETIIGANLKVLNTTLGAITDVDGNFSVKVPVGAKLRVSYIGYTPQTFTIKNAQTLNVYLVEDVQRLNDLVVIGYGSSRKQDLSTSVVSVDLGKDAKSGPSNMASMLQGKLPGVTIQNNGGDPLAGASLNIRGMGSRSGDAVLYVVDGVPGAPFKMEDVKNVTVLKDAASAAIYGSTVGSGGVIVITTKNAEQGKLKVDVNASYSFKEPMHLPKVISADQYNMVWTKTKENNPGINLPIVANAKAFPYGATTRTDWLDEIFRTGSLKHYAVTLSGGNNKLKAIGSVSIDHNKGILLNTYRDEIGGRVNVDFNVLKWLNINQNINVNYSNGQGGINTDNHEGVILGAVFYPRSATVYEYDENGNMLKDKYGDPLFGGTIPMYWVNKGISGYGEIMNPVAKLHRLRQNRPSVEVFSTTGLTLMPVEGLKLKSNLSAGITTTRYEDFQAKVPEYGLKRDKNFKTISNSLYRHWMWDNTISYATLLNDVHHFSLMGGFTMSYDNYRDNSTTMTGFSDEREHNTIMNAGTEVASKPTESIVEEAMVSMFGRIGYSYADRYFLTASVRRDLSSKLDASNRSAVFPAVSGSWKISSESFMEETKDVLNLLKLRASWGQVGSVRLVDPYAYNVPVEAPEYPTVYGVPGTPGSMQYGLFQKTISNPNLKWETTESWGIGLDLGLWNSLTLTVDYFNKKTIDLIERVPISSTLGVSEEPLGNIGSVINKGWEFTLNYNKRMGDWTVGGFANLSLLHSEVLGIGNRDFILSNLSVNGMQPVQSTVGQPWNSFYIFKTNGIFKTEDEIKGYTYVDPETNAKNLIQPNARPGDLKFVDKNNDGVIDSEDKDYLGSYMPKYTYAFGANAAYKGLDLSIMFQGLGGNKIYNAFRQMALVGRGQGMNMIDEVMNSFDFDQNSGVPRIGVAADENGNFTLANDFFLEDGAYLRLKNITLGYEIPQAWLNSMHLGKSGMRIYISGENLLTFTKYTGIDPEVGGLGVDGGRYPVSRNVTLGVNFNF